jgi:hypothetical protein
MNLTETPKSSSGLKRITCSSKSSARFLRTLGKPGRAHINLYRH